MSEADKKRPSDSPDAPLKNPKVDVEAKPVIQDEPRKSDPSREKVVSDNALRRKQAEKVEENVKKAVREAIVSNEPGGKRKQLDAAKKAADDISKNIQPQQIKEIKVRVNGNETVHKPSEGAGPNPAPKK